MDIEKAVCSDSVNWLTHIPRTDEISVQVRFGAPYKITAKLK